MNLKDYENLMRTTKNSKHTLKSIWARVDVKKSDECWNWMGCKDKKGYGRVNIEHKIYLVHRLAYELTHGDIPKDLFICHSCDNPSCCNPDHLFSGTHRDNMQDMLSKDRGADFNGENSAKAKLTDEDVRKIRSMYSTNQFTHRDLGTMFGINSSTITRIINRKRWTHI